MQVETVVADVAGGDGEGVVVAVGRVQVATSDYEAEEEEDVDRDEREDGVREGVQVEPESVVERDERIVRDVGTRERCYSSLVLQSVR